MEFFDLNIPFHTNETKQKSLTRLKLAMKAMELGYSGVAYNHTIKGVMSESHSCSISLFPLSSFLKLSSLLSSSVEFHRQLLNVSVTSPFRQYTRLTVIIDSLPQAAALNSGNPILKTYDIVAVCPVNQNAFEHACLTAQVDIIYIDFSDNKFRLKQHLIKEAIKRGVYFEIVYSNLVLDAQVRRQMMSNAKLLVDWTRGKGLIFSSAAPSLTELRGPYDVANLSSLLGLNIERAKAALSKNSRSLIATALRKKHYYNEAIRVERVPKGVQINFNDWCNWDPISSGEGDLLLDDLDKSFSSIAAKPIDFTSTLNGLPSHGFQIKDMLSLTKMELEPSEIANSEITIVSEDTTTTPKTCTEDTEISPSGAEISSPLKDLTCIPSLSEESRLVNSCSTELCTPSVNVNGVLEREVLMEEDDSSVMVIDELTEEKSHDQVTIGNECLAPNDLSEEFVEREKFTEVNDLPVKECFDKMIVLNESKEEDKERNETPRDNQVHGKSRSGRRRVKRRASHLRFLGPFRHFLRSKTFKKKARKSN